MSHLFITGIPTAGKSYLGKKLAEITGGLHLNLDDLREGLVNDERYKKWVNFYLDQDEYAYLTQTSPEKQWQDLINQSEALWPAFLAEIEKHQNDSRLVIFESVNILPHLAKRDLKFPGIVLVGESLEETLNRNIESPRWGDTLELQKLEAKSFFNIERPYYKAEAEKYNYPVFEKADRALEYLTKNLV